MRHTARIPKDKDIHILEILLRFILSFPFFFPLYVSQRNRIEIRRRINNFRHSVIVNRKRRRKIRADISNLVERSSRVYSFSPPILSRKLVGWKRVVRLHVSISRIDDFTRTGSLHHWPVTLKFEWANLTAANGAVSQSPSLPSPPPFVPQLGEYQIYRPRWNRFSIRVTVTVLCEDYGTFR